MSQTIAIGKRSRILLRHVQQADHGIKLFRVKEKRETYFNARVKRRAKSNDVSSRCVNMNYIVLCKITEESSWSRLGSLTRETCSFGISIKISRIKTTSRSQRAIMHIYIERRSRRSRVSKIFRLQDS